MITHLSLENFKSHSKSEFTFAKGTNVLVGRMGSGKSSVLDALCFALYGTFPRLARRDQSVEGLVSMGSNADFAVVQLEFEKAGKKYSVMRKIGKKVSDAEVRCEGRLVQKGAKQATQYIESALGVDYELFTRAIYSEQNRMDHLLSLNPRQRKAEIDWLLGLGQFDTAREAAQSSCSKLSEQAALLSTEADGARLADAEKRIGEQERARAEKQERLGRLVAAAAQTFGRKNELEASLASLEKLRADWLRQSAECERQSGALQRLGRETEGKSKPGQEALSALSLKRKEAEGEVRARKEICKKRQAELSSAASELAVLQSSLKLSVSRQERRKKLQEKLALLLEGRGLQELECEISALQTEIGTLGDRQAVAHAQLSELSSAVQALLGGAAKCPVCDSDLGQGKAGKLSDMKKKEMEQLRALEAQQVERISRAKSRLSSLEKSLSEARLASSEEKRLSEEGTGPELLQKQIGEMEGAAKACKAAFEEAEQKLADSQALLEGAKKEEEEAARLHKIFSELEESVQKLDGARQKLAAIRFGEKDYEAARKSAEALRLDYARAEAEAKGEEQQLALLSELVRSLQAESAALKEKQERAKRYARAGESMAIYKNCLSLAQSELRSSLVEEINAALCEIWPSVYPYSDYSGVKLEADEKDYWLLMDKGGWREVDSVASGGERACLCLALRIAFATVLTPDVGWLILDEPTHNLDADAVALLSEAIQEKIPPIVEQTFVITHDAALGQASQGTVWQLERDKGKGEQSRAQRQL
jgi:exonuclease SbcC